MINRFSTHTLNHKSPFELLFHNKHDYKFFKVFGCRCFPFLIPYNQHKFSFKTYECNLLGYSRSHKGCRCVHTYGRVYTSCSVLFNESAFPYCISSQNQQSELCVTQSLLGPCPSHRFTHLPCITNQYN